MPTNTEEMLHRHLSPDQQISGKTGSGSDPNYQDNVTVGQDEEMRYIYPFIMNRNPSLIIWNIRGDNNVAFRRYMKDLLNTYTPCILAQLETKTESHELIKNEYNFNGTVESPATGRSGGYCYFVT